MEIPPISTQVACPNTSLPKAKRALPFSPFSSIQTGAASFPFLTRFVTSIKSFLYLLLRFVGIVNPPKAAKQEEIKKQEKALGVNPNVLKANDPFRESVFNTDGTLKNQSMYDQIYELYDILSHTSYGEWIARKNEIQGFERDIVAEKPHPFKFFFFLLNNKAMTKNLLAFKDKTFPTLTTKNHSWGEYVPITAIRLIQDPWPDFMGKNRKNLNRYKETLLPQLPGFCKLLSLQPIEGQLKEHLRKEEWDSFISLIIDERKNHFQL